MHDPPHLLVSAVLVVVHVHDYEYEYEDEYEGFCEESWDWLLVVGFERL